MFQPEFLCSHKEILSLIMCFATVIGFILGFGTISLALFGATNLFHKIMKAGQKKWIHFKTIVISLFAVAVVSFFTVAFVLHPFVLLPVGICILTLGIIFLLAYALFRFFESRFMGKFGDKIVSNWREKVSESKRNKINSNIKKFFPIVYLIAVGCLILFLTFSIGHDLYNWWIKQMCGA